jgi:hypothetical protein
MAETPLSRLVVTPETVLIEPGDHTMIPAPFVTTLPDGRASLPAHGFCVSQFHAEGGRAYVLVQLARHRLVLHEAFTPEAARLLAQGMLDAATAIEAAMLEASNAQLDAALAKGKGA